jgi:hypothetical protein
MILKMLTVSTHLTSKYIVNPSTITGIDGKNMIDKKYSVV